MKTNVNDIKREQDKLKSSVPEMIRGELEKMRRDERKAEIVQLSLGPPDQVQQCVKEPGLTENIDNQSRNKE